MKPLPSRLLSKYQLRGMEILCLWFFGWALSIQAAKWTYLRMSDGLPLGSVSGLTLSPKNLVWVRHQDDDLVTEMDGYELFSHSIPADAADKVHQSRSGQLWVTQPDGLYLFHRSRWTAYPVHPIQEAYRQTILRLQSPVSLIPLQINHCLLLAGDRIWEFSVSMNGPQIVPWIDFSSAGFHQCRNMVETIGGEILITTQGGYLVFDGPAKDILEQTPQRVDLPDSLAHLVLSSPLRNPDGSWTFIGEAEGEPRYLLMYQKEAWHWIQAKDPIKPRHFWKDASGQGWAITYNGLYQIQIQDKDILPSDAVDAGLFFDVITDGAGGAWLGTSEGVICQSGTYWQRSPAQGKEDTVYDILQGTNDDYWYATDQALFHSDHHQSLSYPWPKDQETLFQAGNCLYTLNEHIIGVQLSGSILIFDIAKEVFSSLIYPPQPESVMRILGHHEKKGWMLSIQAPPNESAPVITFFDGQRWQPVADTWKSPTPSSDILWYTLVGEEHWVGWAQGAAYTTGQDWMIYEPEDGMGSETPQRLMELKNGKLWMAAGSHVYELDRNRWGKIYYAGDKINDMLETRDGGIWLATNNGVHPFINDGWLSHNTQEGLPSNTVYKLFEDRTGNILAATTRGLCRNVPESDLSPPLTTILTDTTASKEGIGKGSEIRFQGVDRWQQTSASRLLYSYRQDNNPWSAFSPTNRIVLGDLAAGNHRIEVRSMDRNGNQEMPRPPLSFVYTIPWKEDPRLMELIMGAMVIMVVLAGLAVNRHIRLKRSYAEVERLVRSRTEELEKANRELLQDQKMKALGTLASGIAHDFNSILSIIKGSVQLIESRSQKPEIIQKRIQRIHSVIDQGAGIVHSMLGYVRRGAKRIASADLNEVVGEAVKMAEASRSDVEVQIMKPPHPMEVPVDADLIKQILINLIHNASEAMQDKGIVTVRISQKNQYRGHFLWKSDISTPLACIEVEDQGIGIEEANLARVIEPFYTTKAFSARHGTGLGLSMVYEMAKEMDASLTVESTPGQGSSFRIFIALK